MTTTPTTTTTTLPPAVIRQNARTAATDYADAFGAERHLSAQYDTSSRRTREFLEDPLRNTRRLAVDAFVNFDDCLKALRAIDPVAAERLNDEVKVRTKRSWIESAGRDAADAAAVRVVRLGVGA